MLVYKIVKTVSLFLLLTCCSIRADDLPMYGDLKRVFDEHESLIQKFSDLIAEDGKDIRLQYLENSLSYKVNAEDQWIPYTDLNSKNYSELMRKMSIRFAGRVEGKTYLGSISHQVEDKFVIVEIAKYQGTIPHPNCKSNFLLEKNGSCVFPIKADWQAHYSWVSY